MQCNERFFGQRHFDAGSSERIWCDRLRRLKPHMSNGGFALRDRLPALPDHTGGIAQVKYNGMFGVALWDDELGRFVVWNHQGRCYFSADEDRRHPVTAWLDARADELRDLILLGETHVVSPGADGLNYMTAFNRSMSLIKNPRSARDVARIRLAVFDYRRRGAEGEIKPQPTHVERFRALRDLELFETGVDTDTVHLVDHVEVEGQLEQERPRIQALWDAQIGERGFEGLVLHATEGPSYKIKYRDTLDAAIIAFREVDGGVDCVDCRAHFDLLGVIEQVKVGRLERDEWFDDRGRQVREFKVGEPCPICGTATTRGKKALMGAKFALMRPDGLFVDIADGAQLSKISPLLWELEPLYSADGYRWVRPTKVIEVSYQDVYADRQRPMYCFEGGVFVKAGAMQAVCLRPYGARSRDDKTVNPQDLRLEQLHPLVNRIHRIAAITT